MPTVTKNPVFQKTLAKPYHLAATRHGLMVINSQDSYIGRSLLAYGEYAEIEWQFLAQLVGATTGRVLEIGAHCGALSLPLANALSLQGRQLTVLEPQQIIFQQLCANLALNGLMNVTALPVACGRRPGTVHLPHLDYKQRQNFGGVEVTDGPGEFDTTVTCTSVDAMQFSDPLGLIKIDVEGCELAVLEGAVQTLQAYRPLLYLENDRRQHSKPLIEWLWAADYLLWWHLPPLFNPQNFYGTREDLFKMISVNMLAVPAERQINVKDLMPIVDSAQHPMFGTVA